MNYGTLLARQTAKHSKKTFLHWDGVSYSYQEFSALVEKIEKELREISLSQKIVGIYSPNSIFQLSLFLAVQKAGGVPVLIHGHIPIDEMKGILQENQMHYLISDEKICSEKDILFIPARSMNICILETKENLLNQGAVFGALTSGSTSTPKMLFRTYQSWANFFPIQNKIFQIDSKTILYLQGSFSFTGNLNMLLGVLSVGGTLIGSSQLRPKSWIHEIETLGVTHLYLIPSKLSTFTLQIKNKIIGVQKILSGSQLLDERTVRKLEGCFPQSDIILYYGASEMNYVSWLTGKEILKKPESIGRPFPQVKVWIENEEIFVDSEYMAMGIPRPYTVGDRGQIDETGEIIFQGRGEDQFNIRGNQVSKIKILKFMKEIPEIREAEIISFSDEKNEIRLAAFLVAEPEKKAKIIKDLKKWLCPWEMPTRFFFFSELPMTSTGKIDRYQLLKLITESKPVK